MEYKEMKKEELVKLLEEQRHLADAVVAKDNHIENLRVQLDNASREIISLKKELHKALVENENKNHLSKSVDEKDKQVAELGVLNKKVKDEKEVLEKKVSEMTAKIVELEKSNKLVSENNAHLVQMANGYIMNFRSFLKSIQGALELGVELEAMLSEKIKK